MKTCLTANLEVMDLSNVTWTKEQKDAIFTRKCDVLVAASAGTGKTAVLVERIIQGLLDDEHSLDIERLLVVTFTEAAAAEMCQRIRSALEDKLFEEPDHGRVYRQLRRLPQASISTIHAFCSKLLRQYFYYLGLDPNFRIMDGSEANLLRQDIVEEVLAECYTKALPEVLNFLDGFGGRDGDGAVKDLVLKLHAFQQSLPNPRVWQDAVLDSYLPGNLETFRQSPMMEEARQQVKLVLKRTLFVLSQALELSRLPGGPLPYAERLESEIAQVQKFTHAFLKEGWKGEELEWPPIFKRLPSVRDPGVSDELRVECQRLRNAAKGFADGLAGDYFLRSEGEILAELCTQQPALKVLFGLVNAFGEQYKSAKDAMGALDFADLEQLALRLLTTEQDDGTLVPSPLALELEDQFDEVLIDEYQDTNGVQDYILAMLSGASREAAGSVPRFMVGDIKQSIYGFRLTEPKLFLEKYDRFSSTVGAAQRRITLGTNFRCRREIIDGINFVFRQLMNTAVAGIQYDSDAELKLGAEYPILPKQSRMPREAGAPVAAAALEEESHSQAFGQTRLEFYVLDSKYKHKQQHNQAAGGSERDADANTAEGEISVDAADTEHDELERLEREASLIAGRIHRFMDRTSGHLVWDKSQKTYRPPAYKDIVVLLRSVKNRANQVLEILRQAGIPAYADLDTGYFSAVEIRLMLSLLQVLDNPNQDIPLASVLRAPWFDLSTEELTAIRLASPRGRFSDAVKKTAQRSDSLGKKLADITERLHAWRTQSR
ncbi:MAG: UvrD-helicase domain-containing protein, partial [Firmicutes bacterium]|nr:UvrD-helicase domain-containing protein [Bacillota bacterium]